MISKVVQSMDEAVAEIPDGATVMVGGFATGTPYNLIAALHRQGAKDLTAICVSAGQLRRPDVGFLQREGRIKQLISQAGEGEFPGIPQGTLVERVRAGAAGVPAFYTPTGVGTLYAEGKEHRDFNGRTYLLETALTADYALIPARRGDAFGNLEFDLSQRTLNPLMARAAGHTIAEVEELVDVGELDPNFIHCPGVFVDRIVKVPPDGIRERPFNVEGVPTRTRIGHRGMGDAEAAELQGKRKLTREQVLLRALQDLQPGWLVNLGSGFPSYIVNYARPEQDLVFHAENGVIGMGPMATQDNLLLNLVNALGQHVLLAPGAAIVDHAESFAMVRRGRLDVTVLGAYEVAQNRDFANVSRDPARGGVGGGAMDMARNAKRVFLVMEHTTSEGKPRLLKRCTLPLTCPGVVTRVFTDLGVFDFGDECFVMKEVAPGWTVEEVQAVSEASILPDPDLQEVGLQALR